MATTDVSTAATSAELADYIEQNRKLIADVRMLAEALSHEQANWKPAPDRWSVGDCIHHLNTVADIYIPLYSQTVTKARDRGLTGTGPFQYSWLSRKFVATMEPPVKRRIKAPKGMEPGSSDHDVAVLVAEFERAHRAVIDVIAAAEGIDLRRARLTSVFSRLIKLPLGQWFLFNAAHDRRHLWQAAQVMKEPGFPET